MEVASGETVTAPLVPFILVVTVSIAVTVFAPLVFNVTEKVPTPFVNTLFAGKVACESVELKVTVPL